MRSIKTRAPSSSLSNCRLCRPTSSSGSSRFPFHQPRHLSSIGRAHRILFWKPRATPNHTFYSSFAFFSSFSSIFAAPISSLETKRCWGGKKSTSRLLTKTALFLYPSLSLIWVCVPGIDDKMDERRRPWPPTPFFCWSDFLPWEDDWRSIGNCVMDSKGSQE